MERVRPAVGGLKQAFPVSPVDTLNTSAGKALCWRCGAAWRLRWRSPIDRRVVVVDVNSSSVGGRAALTHRWVLGRCCTDETGLLSDCIQSMCRPPICVLFSSAPCTHIARARSGVATVVLSPPPQEHSCPVAVSAHRLASRSNSVCSETVLRRLAGSS